MANGHSLRMATALLVLPAGPSSLLPIRMLVVCVGGAGVWLSGSSADPCALCTVVRGLLVDASGARLPSRGSLWSCASRLTLSPEKENVAGVSGLCGNLSRLVCCAHVLCSM